MPKTIPMTMQAMVLITIQAAMPKTVPTIPAIMLPMIHQTTQITTQAMIQVSILIILRIILFLQMIQSQRIR